MLDRPNRIESLLIGVRELATLEDYRSRHALYKRDADLQALHAALPLMAIWDDGCVSGGKKHGFCRLPRAASSVVPVRQTAD